MRSHVFPFVWKYHTLSPSTRTRMLDSALFHTPSPYPLLLGANGMRVDESFWSCSQNTPWGGFRKSAIGCSQSDGTCRRQVLAAERFDLEMFQGAKHITICATFSQIFFAAGPLPLIIAAALPTSPVWVTTMDITAGLVVAPTLASPETHLFWNTYVRCITVGN